MDCYCYVPIWRNHLIFAVFWNLLVTLCCLEPEYKDISYGGAWKYVTVNPSKEYTDVGLIEENLLFSATNREPLLFTKEMRDEDGSPYPVSIPISVGHTYHCEMRSTKEETTYQHYITASSILGDGRVFIISHILFSLNYKDFEHSASLSSTSECEKQISSTDLHILSTLARTRDQRSQVCSVRLELQRIQNHRKWSCSSSFHRKENNASTVMKTQLDVMTYNIWNFNPYSRNELYIQRINRLVKLVASADPDVIGLQEVRLEEVRGGRMGPSQLDHLRPLLKRYQFVFQPAQMFESSLSDGRSEEGVAILSKHPILYHDYLLLYRNTSHPADGHQRICLHAVIDVPRIGQVHVFNTHYSLSHEAREEATRQILEFMALYEGPAFLLGDLNATPDERAVRMLLDGSNLVDVWSQQHGDKLGYTFNTLENKLSKRIDYILMREFPGVDIADVTVMSDNARSNICSDHRAVLAKTSFKSCL